MLVGIKQDLRDYHDYSKFVSLLEGQELSQKLKVNAYLECSNLTKVGVLDVFVMAAEAVVYRGSP